MGSIHARRSLTIMSQRERLQSYIQRRILFLNQQINQQREAELREKNLQRLRILQRGRDRESRRVICQYYRINVNRTRQSRKFKAAQNVLNVSVRELPEKSPAFVCRLFRDVIKNVKKKMEASPNDYLRVNIDHPSLDSPVWLELDEDKILNKIEGTQQSKKDFLLSDGATELDFFHVKYPEGSGCTKMKHLHLDKEKFKKSKRAIFQINNPWGSLCLPVLLLSTVFMPRNPKFQTPTLTKNGKE
jgi:hypothetical protein